MMKCKTDQKHIDGHFKKIEIWCKANNISLIGGKEFLYCPERSTIFYNKKCGKKKIIFTLLHECGHVVIQNKKDYKKQYKTQYRALFDGRVDGSLGWRVDVLKEEFEAWKVGFSLAKEMELAIDEEEYNKCSSGFLKLYCMWVANPKEYGNM